MIGRLILKLKDEFDPESAKKEILKLGYKIIDHNDKTFLVEDNNTHRVTDDLHFSGLFSVITSEVMMHKCINVNLCGLTDQDVDTMSEEEVKTKLKTIRDTALWWASQENDDRCWLDDVKVLQSILPHGNVNFTMPEDLTFIENCIRFKRTRCPKNPKLHEW